LFLACAEDKSDENSVKTKQMNPEIEVPAKGFKLRWERFKEVEGYGNELKLFAKKVKIDLGNAAISTQGKVENIIAHWRITGKDSILRFEIPKDEIVALQKGSTGALKLSPVFYLTSNPIFESSVLNKGLISKITAKMNGKEISIPIQPEVNPKQLGMNNTLSFAIDGKYFELVNPETRQTIEKDSIQIKIFK
jgi:hypothetical protein